MAPKFGFLVLLVSQMASPPNKFVTQMVAPPNKSIKWCHHNIINLLKVVTPFGWLFYLVVTPFGRQVVRENQTLEPFLEYKMDSNENFSCHSVISRFKWTKYQFLSDQCRVPLNFANQCIKNPTMKDMFPLSNSSRTTRISEKYYVQPARTDRLRYSAIPFMQRLLNSQTK